jgi:hypothetical protein
MADDLPALEAASAPGDWLSRLNGWPMPSPTDASSASLTDANARLGDDVDRYTFIVVDLHHLLLAGLPAHFESYMPSQTERLSMLLRALERASWSRSLRPVVKPCAPSGERW